MSLESRLLGLWYGPAWRSAALWPLETLYRGASALRRRAYLGGLLAIERVAAPVVVVGNLTVGGTGKTPVASWLAAALRSRGMESAIVLRGYGGRHRGLPVRVTPDSDPREVGDEAVMHARRGAGLVYVGRDRVAAARAAVEAGAQVVVCDDGLQHLRLARQFEVVVVDAARGLGNGHQLPAGPLREPGSRLASVDAVVLTERGHGMTAAAMAIARATAPRSYQVSLRPGAVINLLDGTRRTLADFRGKTVWAVAAIGHPEAFFTALRSGGLSVDARAYPDHHTLDASTFSDLAGATVLMTEKDAVKCRDFAQPGWWYVDLEVAFRPPSAADDLVAAVLAATRPVATGGGRLG